MELAGLKDMAVRPCVHTVGIIIALPSLWPKREGKMYQPTQEEKELIIVSLGNSLADPEQSDIHQHVADLYDKLRVGWSRHGDHHTADEIIAIRGKN